MSACVRALYLGMRRWGLLLHSESVLFHDFPNRHIGREYDGGSVMQFEKKCVDVPQFEGAVHLPNGCDFSDLVGNSVIHDERFDAAQFDALLTDYDRILLRFGMRISW